MKAASVLVSTFGIWLIAKQRTAKYWTLVSKKNAASNSPVISGVGGSGSVTPALSLPPLPDISSDNGLKKAGAKIGLDIIIG